MSTIHQTGRSSADFGALPELRAGDRMKREEFHRRYERYSDDVKFELVEGVVYMASPARCPHGELQLELGTLFGVYKAHTPGVSMGDNTTLILDDENEPQPDLYLRILGGQTRLNEGDYLVGAPELLAEVAHSSLSLDLGAKKRAYRKTGGLEYLVVGVEKRQIHWFDLRNDEVISPGDDGVYRSQVFPGLWLNAEALFARDTRALLQTLQEGLDTEEHARFVESLRQRENEK